MNKDQRTNPQTFNPNNPRKKSATMELKLVSLQIFHYQQSWGKVGKKSISLQNPNTFRSAVFNGIRIKS